MEILGYFAAFVMGAVLGSLGGGGSILTVPILVYLMKVPPVVATGYSLLIVGAAACPERLAIIRAHKTAYLLRLLFPAANMRLVRVAAETLRQLFVIFHHFLVVVCRQLQRQRVGKSLINVVLV